MTVEIQTRTDLSRIYINKMKNVWMACGEEKMGCLAQPLLLQADISGQHVHQGAITLLHTQNGRGWPLSHARRHGRLKARHGFPRGAPAPLCAAYQSRPAQQPSSSDQGWDRKTRHGRPMQNSQSVRSTSSHSRHEFSPEPALWPRIPTQSEAFRAYFPVLKHAQFLCLHPSPGWGAVLWLLCLR